MKRPIEIMARELEALAEELWALDGVPNAIEQAHELLVRKADGFRQMSADARYPRMVRDDEGQWLDPPRPRAMPWAVELKNLREREARQELAFSARFRG
jgi:hypothetical protein